MNERNRDRTATSSDALAIDERGSCAIIQEVIPRCKGKSNYVLERWNVVYEKKRDSASSRPVSVEKFAEELISRSRGLPVTQRLPRPTSDRGFQDQ